MSNIYITIKDSNGILRPKAYLEKREMHPLQKHPKLENGEEFVEVIIHEHWGECS